MTVPPPYQVHCEEGLECVTPPHLKGASGVCQKPEDKSVLPAAVVGKGEKCQMTVSPEFQVHCKEGLECITPTNLKGASGVCQKPEDKSVLPVVVVGKGEKCQMTVAPQYQVQCEEGLVCLMPPDLRGTPGICQKPEVKTKQPAFVGEGEKCQMTVSPQYQVHCEEGLDCVTPPNILSAFGICSKVETKPAQPSLAGEGQECKTTVSPNYQVHCEEGLICSAPLRPGTPDVCTRLAASLSSSEVVAELASVATPSLRGSASAAQDKQP